MKVLTVGSLRHIPTQEEKDSFITACRDIGAALARAGCEFVIGSSSLTTADRYVMEGAETVGGEHKVFVFRPEKGATPIFPISGSPGGGKFRIVHKRLKGPWAGGRVAQIQAADCVLVIGGSRGSGQVAYSAMALEKPVLAVASFGGAAEDTWSQFEPFYERLGAVGEDIGNLRETWQPGYEQIVVRALTQLVRRQVFKRTTLSADLFPLLFNLALFALWVGLFTYHPISLELSFFGLLLTSAFLGTGLRGSLRTIVDPTEHRSRSAFIAEFSAGLVLAFALSLLYLAGSFTFTGDFVAFYNDTQPDLQAYRRVAVAMGLFGLSGGWLLERVAENLTGWLSSRLPNTN